MIKEMTKKCWTGTEWDLRIVDRKWLDFYMYMFCCRVKWEMILTNVEYNSNIWYNIVYKELGEVGDKEKRKIMTLLDTPTEFYMKLLYIL